jgi:hypothetical protein
MKFLTKNAYILSAIAILIAYLSPNIFFPENARFLIHDNLDSNVIWFKVLHESGKMFSSNDANIPNILGGMPRGCYFSEFHFMSLLYYFFPPLLAYNLNIIIIHFLAFFSMYFFIRKYVFKYANEWAIVIISLSFSLLPFWPFGGATITAQPLLLYAFLNILNNEFKVRNWLIILLFPFYSSLAFSNLFFIIALFVGFVTFCIYKRKINFYFILALFLFVIASVCAEYRLFYMQYIAHFESHRELFVKAQTLNWKGVIGVSLRHLVFGQYHFYTLQFPFLIIACLAAIIFGNTRKEKLTLLFFLALTYIISLLYVLPMWAPATNIMQKNAVLNSFALRFYSLSTLAWFIIFAFSVRLLLNANFLLKYVVILFGIGSIIVSFFSIGVSDYFGNKYAENSFCNTYIYDSDWAHGSFKEYYKINLFDTIKKKIKPGSYYTACLGIDPAILQFNNYNTIDGYFYYYAKSYNSKIKSICKLEMEKSKTETIGSRVFLVCDDINKNKQVIDNLQLDFDEMKKMGVKYIFSDRKVNSDRLIDESFYHDKSTNIYVYLLD